ncbi:unnamed protein product [Hymenolepis diminuta]|uniref:Uncharacterized protein n=1 Tax=Hymenolepis diminuta TaxID=6216 RepID=A0A564YC58_HYMDI|nr:unnamed protein product [Hymenolepis diminuta]
MAHKAAFVFHSIKTHTCQLPDPMLPAHLPSSSASSPLSPFFCNSFQTRCGFLEYIFGLTNSWCSAPRLLQVLTQTATSW